MVFKKVRTLPATNVRDKFTDREKRLIEISILHHVEILDREAADGAQHSARLAADYRNILKKWRM